MIEKYLLKVKKININFFLVTIIVKKYKKIILQIIKKTILQLIIKDNIL